MEYARVLPNVIQAVLRQAQLRIVVKFINLKLIQLHPILMTLNITKDSVYVHIKGSQYNKMV